MKIVTNPNLASGINIIVGADELKMAITLYIRKPLELLGLIEILEKTLRPNNITSIEYGENVVLSDNVKEKIRKILVTDEVVAGDFMDFDEVDRRDLQPDNLRKIITNLTTNSCTPNLDSKRSKIINYVHNILGDRYPEDEAYDLFVQAYNTIRK